MPTGKVKEWAASAETVASKLELQELFKLRTGISLLADRAWQLSVTNIDQSLSV